MHFRVFRSLSPANGFLIFGARNRPNIASTIMPIRKKVTALITIQAPNLANALRVSTALMMSSVSEIPKRWNSPRLGPCTARRTLSP